MFVSMWITWPWCLFSTSGLQRIPFCPTFYGTCSFSLPFICFTSLRSSNTAKMLSRDNIHIISLLVPQMLQATVPPPFKSSYLRHPTGPHLAGPVCFVSLCPGTCFLDTATCPEYSSTTFCQQFGLTPLPLSDLDLCGFVSYLHQQQ